MITNEFKCDICNRDATRFYENDKQVFVYPKWTFRCEKHQIRRKKEITREEMIVLEIMDE
jgi:hypothetical protein